MAKTFTAARTFTHKTFGRLGIAELVLESESDIGFLLNGQELPPQSVDHFLTFALQSLQDAYAGAKDADDAQARFDSKLERILEGTLGTRSGKAGESALTVAIRVVLRPLVKEAYEETNGKDSWKEVAADDQIEIIDGKFESLADAAKAAVTAKAEAAIEAKKAELAAKAELKGSIKITF